MPFDNGTPFTLNFTGFTGAGFSPTPGAGQLSSNEFRFSGFSDAYAGYGATATTANTDYARGTITGTADPTTAGVYAATTGVAALGTSFVIQPTGAEFGTPAGTITLRVQYTGTAPISGFNFGYDGVYRNNADRSTAVTVQYAVQAAATEPTTYSTAVAALGFTTPLANVGGTAAAWTQTTLPSTAITAVINPNDYVYVRFTIGDNGGSGSRDETGFDNITLSAIGGAPPATISIGAPVTAAEGNAGTTPFTYAVTRSATAVDGTVQATITGGTGLDAADIASVTVDGVPVAGFTLGTPFTVALSGAATSASIVVNIAGDTTLEADEAFTVTLSGASTGYTVGTASATGTVTNDDIGAVTPIYTVQGSGAASALVGQLVTIEGIVTGDYQDNDADGTRNLQGFFVQELTGDGNLATSDGIFVFQADAPGTGVGTAVKVGDRVRVTGRVTEFARFASETAANLTETQISVSNSATAITVVTSSELTPTQVIAQLAQDVTLPTTGVTTLVNGVRVANLETVEGMLVRLPQVLTISEGFNLDRFGDLRVSAGGQPFTYTQLNAPNAAGYTQSLIDIAASSVAVDDGLRVQNPNPITVFGTPLTNANAPSFGDQFSGLVGNVRFSDAASGAAADNLTQATSESTQAYRILPSNTPTIVDAALRTAAPGRVDGDLKLVGTNLLNFFTTLDNGTANTGPGNTLNSRGANTAEELARQKDRLYTALLQLDGDMIVVNELENNGFGAGSAIATLVSELNARPGSPGDFAFVDPGVTYLGGDAIKVSILYRTSKLQIAPGTTAQVLDDTRIPALISAGLLPANFLAQSTVGGVFNGVNTSRAVLVTTFQQVGSSETFTVAAVHNKSKSGNGTGADADQGDGAGAWNNQRNLAVQAIDAFLKSNPTGSTDSDKILFGDFNSYGREASINFLSATAGFRNLITQDIGSSASSYVFDGQKGTLDYSFASQSLVPNIKLVAEWNVNSPELDALDYNTDFGRPTTVFDATSPYRYSDHDPVVVDLLLDPSVQVTRGGAVSTVYNGFAQALAAAQAGDTVVVRKPGTVGNAGAQTVATDNLTVSSAAGFTASFALGAGVSRFGLSGAAGATVAANALGNTITSGGGADTIDGGGGSDTVVLAGSRGEYAFAGQAANLLATRNGVTDTLQNVEFLTFAASSETIATSAVCYLRGTGIMTPRGEVGIEHLRVGDLVTTQDGPRPVKWVGRQSFASRFMNGNLDLQPVRIAAGALGVGCPAQDLFVSLDHALLIDGLLVPAGQILNGGSIATVPLPELLEYYNVELDRHACLLAHGVWAESYADTGNRRGFHNYPEFVALYPAHIPAPTVPCAPRTQVGDAALRPIRARLGCHDDAFTTDPALRLEAGGAVLTPFEIDGPVHRFRLPKAVRSMRLLSRSDVPARSGLGGTDHRRLGVSVGQLVVAGTVIDLGSGAFGAGFHPCEGGHRWTDGHGVLRVAARRGAVIEVAAGALAAYRLTADATVAAVA